MSWYCILKRKYYFRYYDEIDFTIKKTATGSHFLYLIGFQDFLTMVQSNIFHIATYSTQTYTQTESTVLLNSNYTCTSNAIFVFWLCLPYLVSVYPVFKKFYSHSLNCFHNLLLDQSTTYSLQYAALHMSKRHETWYVPSCEYSLSLTQALCTVGTQKSVNYIFEKGEDKCKWGKKKKEKNICRNHFLQISGKQRWHVHMRRIKGLRLDFFILLMKQLFQCESKPEVFLECKNAN